MPIELDVCSRPIHGSAGPPAALWSVWRASERTGERARRRKGWPTGPSWPAHHFASPTHSPPPFRSASGRRARSGAGSRVRPERMARQSGRKWRSLAACGLHGTAGPPSPSAPSALPAAAQSRARGLETIWPFGAIGPANWATGISKEAVGRPISIGDLNVRSSENCNSALAPPFLVWSGQVGSGRRRS